MAGERFALDEGHAGGVDRVAQRSQSGFAQRIRQIGRDFVRLKCCVTLEALPCEGTKQ